MKSQGFWLEFPLYIFFLFLYAPRTHEEYHRYMYIFERWRDWSQYRVSFKLLFYYGFNYIRIICAVNLYCLRKMAK